MSPFPNDDPEDRATLAAVRRSVQLLDADPGARTAQGFRSRGQSALLQSTPAASGNSATPRRLVIVGVTMPLFGLIATPGFAGPGTIANRVAGASDAVGKMLGNRRGHHDSHDTDGTNSTPEHPENHDGEVSPATQSPLTDDETHGEQVSAVARDNRGHPGNARSDSDNGQDSTTNGASSDETTTEFDQSHGAAVSAVARDNRGAAVSAAARAGPDDGNPMGTR